MCVHSILNKYNLFLNLSLSPSKSCTLLLIICKTSLFTQCEHLQSRIQPVFAFVTSRPAAAVLASPTLSRLLVVLGVACQPGGASGSSRCPPGVCRLPGWARSAVEGCWGPRPAALAAHPPAPSRGDR